MNRWRRKFFNINFTRRKYIFLIKEIDGFVKNISKFLLRGSPESQQPQTVSVSKYRCKSARRANPCARGRWTQNQRRSPLLQRQHLIHEFKRHVAFFDGLITKHAVRISDQSPLVTVEYHRDAVQHFYVATVAMARMGLCATVTALLEYFLRISDQNIIQQQQWCGLVGGWPTTVPDLTFPTNLDGLNIFKKSQPNLDGGFLITHVLKVLVLGKIMIFRRKKAPKFSPRFARK